MSLSQVLDVLEPMERRAVRLVYGEGHSVAETGRILRVDATVVRIALAGAYRRIARRVDDGPWPEA